MDKMNKKGVLGNFIGGFIIIFIGFMLLPTIAQEVGDVCKGEMNMSNSTEPKRKQCQCNCCECNTCEKHHSSKPSRTKTILQNDKANALVYL